MAYLPAKLCACMFCNEIYHNAKMSFYITILYNVIIMSSIPDKTPNLPRSIHHSALMRWLFFIMGFVFVGLGMLGVILPGLPTTVFVLLAGYCWAKSSTRFHDWLLRHKVFGKILLDWQERRAMPRFAKYMAWGMMCASSVFLFYRMPADKMWLAYCIGGLCLAISIWMAKLPDA